MNLSDIGIGTKLELELHSDIEKKRKRLLVSEFEWHDGNNSAYIAVPIFEGNYFPMHAGTVLNVYFIKNDNLYMFEASVTGRKTEGNISLIRIDLNGNISEIQRRQFFRFDCYVKIKYRRVNSFNEEFNINIPYKSTKTRDLSGGGFCMVLEDKMDLGALLECQLELDENRTVNFFGNVARVVKFYIDEEIRYDTGVSFTKIKFKDREAIINYIFKEQRKLIKKGLI